MTAILNNISTDIQTGGLIFGDKIIRPLWLRERATEPDAFNPINHQCLNETANLDPDLIIQDYRHLQGYYIDHDGPQCLYKHLATGHKKTFMQRES